MVSYYEDSDDDNIPDLEQLNHEEPDDDYVPKLEEINHEDSDRSDYEEEEEDTHPKRSPIARKNVILFKDTVESNKKLETMHVDDAYHKWDMMERNRCATCES